MMGHEALSITKNADSIICMMPKDKPLTLKATQRMGRPITQHAHFAMVELAALEGLGELIRRAPKSAQLIVSLIRHMSPGSGGVVVVSRETMRELIGCSMPTVERALRLLIAEGWVQRIRVGGAHALAINRRIAWMGDRGEIQHAIFDATVIASRAEQDAIALEPAPMRAVPVVGVGEDVIPFGDGADPPSQQLLIGVEPAARAAQDKPEAHQQRLAEA
jgi:DNA-binding transcriptional MocR family regulator